MAKDHGPSVKDNKQYEGLRKKGMSKSRAAAIANTPGKTPEQLQQMQQAEQMKQVQRIQEMERAHRPPPPGIRPAAFGAKPMS